jgi:D-alanyl-D-alanine carboxypeptidase/D-alanyl-D-alanine-endopeptidase (penicillin-binding protein 4)
MIIAIFFISLLGTLCLPLRMEAVEEIVPSPLQPALNRLQESAGRVGVHILAIPSGRVLYGYHSQETFVPASLVKIFTSYSALKQLGPYHHFSTALWAREKPQGSVIAGDIWIKSEGDPFFLGEKAPMLARQLRDLGVRRIQGGVYADNSFFEPQTEHICLDGHCEDFYNPVISATSVDFNTIVLRLRPALKLGSPVHVEWFPPGDYVLLNNLATTSGRNSETSIKIESLGITPEGRERYRITGKLPLTASGSHEYRVNAEDPGAFVARSLRTVLQQTGIEVLGPAARGSAIPAGATMLVSHESPPLADMIYGMNRYSNNFMAEMLLRSLGGDILGRPGTAAKGLSVILETLQEIGVPEQEVRLSSGSGLSRQCRASPQAFCRVLLKAYEDSSMSREFISSLAVNGEDGTLKNRLLKAGTVIRGKTGSLNDVVTFSGYVTNPLGHLCAVTILLNAVPNPGEAREALDGFLERLAKDDTWF